VARQAQKISAVSLHLQINKKSLSRKEKAEAQGFLPARPCAGLLFGRPKKLVSE